MRNRIEIVRIDKRYVVRLIGNTDFSYGSHVTKKAAEGLKQKTIERWARINNKELNQ